MDRCRACYREMWDIVVGLVVVGPVGICSQWRELPCGASGGTRCGAYLAQGQQGVSLVMLPRTAYGNATPP